MNQNYDLLNHVNKIYRPIQFTKRLGSLSFYNLIWMDDAWTNCCTAQSFCPRCFLLFKNLIIFFSEKTKSIKYEGIKSIIEGENSAGGN